MAEGAPPERRARPREDRSATRCASGAGSSASAPAAHRLGVGPVGRGARGHRVRAHILGLRVSTGELKLARGFDLPVTSSRDSASFEAAEEAHRAREGRWASASSGCFVCEQCGAEDLRCGPHTRERFCRPCAEQRAAQSTKRSSAAYQRSEKGREKHRKRSLAHYHRRGKELRRQRRAREAVERQGHAGSGGSRPAGEELRDGADGAVAPVRARPSSSSTPVAVPHDVPGAAPASVCLTQKRVGGVALRRVRVGPASPVSAAQVLACGGVEEVVDEKPSPFGPTPQAEGDGREAAPKGGAPSGHADAWRTGPVFTTVAEVRAALARARQAGRCDVVVWGRCARCGRVGRVVHFDGVLRASARAPPE